MKRRKNTNLGLKLRENTTMKKGSTIRKRNKEVVHTTKNHSKKTKKNSRWREVGVKVVVKINNDPVLCTK